MRRLEGRVALVTGAGSGIGRAIALLFAAEGARVALLGRRPEPLAAAAAAAGEGARAVAADVTREPDAARAVAETAAAWGGLDVLVNCAGHYDPRPASETPLDAWERTLAVNVTGPLLLARAAFPWLRRSRRGSVVNVSSTLSLRPVRGAAAYCVSKAALDMLTAVLALEWAESGVRVNSLLLGIVDTPIHAARGGDPEAFRSAAARLHPLGRIGRPEDAARAALHLASDESAWTTGARFVVDGGISLA